MEICSLYSEFGMDFVNIHTHSATLEVDANACQIESDAAQQNNRAYHAVFFSGHWQRFAYDDR